MTNPMITIHNATTGEVINREMTATEFAQYKAEQVAAEAKIAEQKIAATAKEALLTRLGITADEATLLLG